MIIDGGPRKIFNTASMLQKFADGASSVCDEIEVKTIRLYELDYKGCMSCMACKIKGKASNVCKFKDALTPVLEEIAQADGLVLGSPVYFGDVTGQMRAFLERLAFPWLSYNDYSLTAPKKMPVLIIETMNGTPERNNSQGYGSMEHCITAALAQPEHLIAEYGKSKRTNSPAAPLQQERQQACDTEKLKQLPAKTADNPDQVQRNRRNNRTHFSCTIAR